MTFDKRENVVNRQTIDAIGIRTVKLEIYIYSKLTLFVMNNVWYVLCNLFSTQAVARHGYVIMFYETTYTISKSGKIIVHATELRRMYHIVSSGSLAKSEKVELFAYLHFLILSSSIIKSFLLCMVIVC
jgi:hypothetical protein